MWNIRLFAVLIFFVSYSTSANTTIDQSLYNQFVKYTKYAAAAYASDCPLPPNNSTIVAYLSNATTDTQATVFRNDLDQELILAFRGTSDLEDFFTDFNQALVPYNSVGVDCSSCLKVNNGTLIAYQSLTSQTLSTLSSQSTLYPSYNLVVTGHSLGGALASIASPSLLNSGYPDLTTYTFGQFRTGDPNYASYIDSVLPYPRLFRITHTNDGVPQTISQSQGYRHHETEFWEVEPFGANDTVQCEGEEDPTCNDSTDGVGIGTNGRGINPAHLCYTGILIGNPVDAGASACNAVSALPQECSTDTGGGIVRRVQG